MTDTPRYCKRLIEVDLPIKRISAHSRREKSIRHGHISTLHIWWARRPLAACRAVTCAALWPDPADPLCPESFRNAAREQMLAWATNHLGLLGEESYISFNKIAHDPKTLDNRVDLRAALLDFIADFANWDNSNVAEFLATSRALTLAAHEALGGMPGTHPLVFDPFAGGGSIPLEALRVGADTFASDLNPIPVLLNKVVLELVPKYGQRLADEVRKWGQWIKQEAEKELCTFYPRDVDGATPTAYLWARTIRCEGPGCGAEVPLIRSLWLAKRAERSEMLQIIARPDQRRCDFRILVKSLDGWTLQGDSKTKIDKPSEDGTIRAGSATCPCCGYTTPNARVRIQLSAVKGGASTARLFTVVVSRASGGRRQYRLPSPADEEALSRAARELHELATRQVGEFSLIPDEPIPTQRPSPNARGLSAVTRMGVETFGDAFTPRQLLMLVTLSRLTRAVSDGAQTEGLTQAAALCLALAVDRCVDNLSSLVTWTASGEFQGHTFARQALPIVWDFVEVNPLADAGGNWDGAVEWVAKVLEATATPAASSATVAQANAADHPLSDDSAAALITDPPYYDAVPYSDLSKFFFVWLKRSLGKAHEHLVSDDVPIDEEAIWNPTRIYSKTGTPKDEAFYESQMKRAFVEARRVVAPDGIGVVVFAHKTTAGWEAVLGALIAAGWTATGSWPIDTERAVRTNAIGTASLGSSVHIVVRPRENPDGSLRDYEVGEWRAVRAELPRRIHEWMPRLADEGVVGADAIFACLGPALEVFSRYSRVEKASGEAVTLKDYLEEVWAAVAREALSLVLESADTAGLEPDGRLTAIWLWTLGGGGSAGESNLILLDSESSDENEMDAPSMKTVSGGFVLEFDAARKIAQGLGARLDELDHMVEVKGDKARLLPVAERAKYLFGKTASAAATVRKTKKKQLGLFAEIEEAAAEQGWNDMGAPQAGKTTLDRIHQSMLLFAAGRGEALKRFLVEEGVGNQPRFWKLAQALSALYPPGTDEKRWIDGVLGRKKGFGFA